MKTDSCCDFDKGGREGAVECTEFSEVGVGGNCPKFSTGSPNKKMKLSLEAKIQKTGDRISRQEAMSIRNYKDEEDRKQQPKQELFGLSANSH